MTSTHKTGHKLKMAGQQIALQFAGSWADNAIASLRLFCVGRQRFAFEEFREAAPSYGLEPPPSHKAWGALPRIAVREGLIRSTTEYRPATSPRTHAHPVRVWEVVR